MANTPLQKIDNNLIPIGEDCYRLELIASGEQLDKDVERYGKDSRQYSYGGGEKSILCPYWQRTNYGTVRCLATGAEEVDEDDRNAHAIIKQLFNVTNPYEVFQSGGLLYDEVKTCGINLEVLPSQLQKFTDHKVLDCMFHQIKAVALQGKSDE